MKMEKVKRFTGVFQYEHAVRRHNGKPDVTYYITYKDGNGNKIREKVGCSSEGYTAAMASNVRKERVQQLNHGSMIDRIQPRRKSITLEQAWEEYVRLWLNVEVKNPGPDLSRWKNHLCSLRFRPLDTIGVRDLDDLKAQILASGKSPQTVKHVLALLRRVMNKAKRWRLWHGESPFDEYETVKVDNRRQRYLQPEEAKALLSEVRRRSIQWYNISLLSLHTGMRFGEICRLRAEHVDLATGRAIAVDPKNSISRAVLLTSTAAEMLREVIAGQAEGLLFTNRHGEHIREVSGTFERSVEALGLNKGIRDNRFRIVFHSWRHTYASYLAIAGVPLSYIALLMGHTNEEITARYAHLMPDHVQGAEKHIELYMGITPQSSGGGAPNILPDAFEGIR